LVALQAKVAETGADLGIAFDGDADRIGAIDGHGRIIPGDMLVAVLCHRRLPRHPGGVVIADVKTSKTVFDAIAKLGGTPLM